MFRSLIPWRLPKASSAPATSLAVVLLLLVAVYNVATIQEATSDSPMLRSRTLPSRRLTEEGADGEGHGSHGTESEGHDSDGGDGDGEGEQGSHSDGDGDSESHAAGGQGSHHSNAATDEGDGESHAAGGHGSHSDADTDEGESHAVGGQGSHSDAATDEGHPDGASASAAASPTFAPQVTAGGCDDSEIMLRALSCDCPVGFTDFVGGLVFSAVLVCILAKVQTVANPGAYSFDKTAYGCSCSTFLGFLLFITIPVFRWLCLHWTEMGVLTLLITAVLACPIFGWSYCCGVDQQPDDEHEQQSPRGRE